MLALWKKAFFILLGSPGVLLAAPPLSSALLFQADFDKGPQANFAKGDGRIYTAPTLARKSVKRGLSGDGVRWSGTGGRHGGALHFSKKQPELVFFRGAGNVPETDANFRGTVSLWMRCEVQDLPAGEFVDPLQITDKKWNDASFFLDFDKAKERDFRLGVFANHDFWNPKKQKFESLPTSQRPMVVVQPPPFAADKWKHIAFTWEDFNRGQDKVPARLYVNGELVGTLSRPQRFTWEPEKVVIMLGINYVGAIDELSIFNRSLTRKEIRLLAKTPAQALLPKERP